MGQQLNAGIDFLEFKPSEIAAAVAISACGEMQGLDIDNLMPCLKHVDKVMVVVEPVITIITI